MKIVQNVKVATARSVRVALRSAAEPRWASCVTASADNRWKTISTKTKTKNYKVIRHVCLSIYLHYSLA